jgi:hypothetical protein
MKTAVSVVSVVTNVMFGGTYTITLSTRLKQINDQRKRMAEKENETKEMREKWKHDNKPEKGKKQNPRDALKRKVCYSL